MAETAKGKKFIRIQGYTRADGTKVPTHDRSTPKTAHGPSAAQAQAQALTDRGTGTPRMRVQHRGQRTTKPGRPSDGTA